MGTTERRPKRPLAHPHRRRFRAPVSSLSGDHASAAASCLAIAGHPATLPEPAPVPGCTGVLLMFRRVGRRSGRRLMRSDRLPEPPATCPRVADTASSVRGDSLRPDDSASALGAECIAPLDFGVTVVARATRRHRWFHAKLILLADDTASVAGLSTRHPGASIRCESHASSSSGQQRRSS